MTISYVNSMKKVKAIFLLLIFVIMVSGCQNIEKVEKQGKIIDGKEVVAKVNDELIFRSDYDRQVAQVKGALEANGQDFTTAEGKKILKDVQEKVLEAMISDQLILQQAKQNKVFLQEGELKQAISDLEQYHGGKDALDTYLTQQGFDRQSFETFVEEQLIISNFKDKLSEDISVTDEEVKKYYDDNKEMFELPGPEIRASHILVETEDEAKDILEKINDGVDFDVLAKEHSIDPGSKDMGGDLGYFAKGRMVPEFENAAFALKPGEISDIVKSENGYHIIKVVDERTSLSFDDAFDYISYTLEDNKKNGEISKNLSQWEKQSKIEKYL